MKLLIVDDSRAVTLIISQILKNLGIQDLEIKTAEDGNSALDVIADWRVDLIFTDLYMPGMNGLQLMHTIVREGLKIPVCVITTEGVEEKLAAVRAAGAMHIIHKPFEEEDFKWVITSYFRLYNPEYALAPMGGRAEPSDSIFTEIANIKKLLHNLCRQTIDVSEALPVPFDTTEQPFVIGLFDDDEKKFALYVF